jgi:hypothetical protein
MTDAPETIWAGPSEDDKGVFWDVGHWDADYDAKCIAYTRTGISQAKIAELYEQAIGFRESIRKAALDSEQGHEILDICWDSYFPEMPVAGVHSPALKETP